MEKKIDSFLLTIFIFLLLIGFLALTTASAPFSQEKFGNSFYYLTHQLIFGLLPGFLFFLIISKLSLEGLKKYSLLILIFNLIFLVLIFIPGIGIKIRGGIRWVNFGPFSFQPSEFLKLTFIIYLAAWLSTRVKEKGLKTFFAFLIMLTLIGVLLVAQPDISTLGIIFATALLMFFLAKTPLWQTFLIFLTAPILFLPLVKSAPYRWIRILTFLNPEVDPLGIGYHIKQTQISIGSGKLFGLGLGLSQQKFGNLPQSFTDSIFAIFAEETGFFGALLLISLYLLFFWRGFRIGMKAKNEFEKNLAFGISFWILFQAFFNMGAMVGILPLSGIPLPFLSYGGSHLISEIGGVAILLKISKK